MMDIAKLNELLSELRSAERIKEYESMKPEGEDDWLKWHDIANEKAKEIQSLYVKAFEDGVRLGVESSK